MAVISYYKLNRRWARRRCPRRSRRGSPRRRCRGTAARALPVREGARVACRRRAKMLRSASPKLHLGKWIEIFRDFLCIVFKCYYLLYASCLSFFWKRGFRLGASHVFNALALGLRRERDLKPLALARRTLYVRILLQSHQL